jgi:hypothetical protein
MKKLKENVRNVIWTQQKLTHCLLAHRSTHHEITGAMEGATSELSHR